MTQPTPEIVLRTVMRFADEPVVDHGPTGSDLARQLLELREVAKALVDDFWAFHLGHHRHVPMQVSRAAFMERESVQNIKPHLPEHAEKP